VSTLRAQYPDNPVLQLTPDDARLVVSEPLGGLRGAWQEVPEGTCVVLGRGQQEERPFGPTVLEPVG
jgi:glutamine amidotransferase